MRVAANNYREGKMTEAPKAAEEKHTEPKEKKTVKPMFKSVFFELNLLLNGYSRALKNAEGPVPSLAKK